MVLKDKKGQSIVEFAFILPVFVLLLVGFMHMALVLHDYLAMGEATREIARYAAVGTSEDEIKNHVKFNVSGFYKIKPEEILINKKNNEQLGDYVEVNVTMHFDSSHGVLLTEKFMPQQLSTTLTMRRE